MDTIIIDLEYYYTHADYTLQGIDLNGCLCECLYNYKSTGNFEDMQFPQHGLRGSSWKNN